jgi:general secretion pathway protein I
LPKVKGRNRDRGFTLLEVVVAFTIVALVLAAVLRIFSDGLRSVDRAEKYVQATMIAQSKLDELASQQPVVAQQQAGEADGGFSWQAEAAPYFELNASDLLGSRVQLFRFTVAVGWGGGWPARTVTLSTLRVSGGEQVGEEPLEEAQ